MPTDPVDAMSDTATAASPNRLVALDLLRLLAVLLVIGHHLPLAPDTLPGWITPPLQAWGLNGDVGVDLFFVLSGFLVGGLLLAEHRRHGNLSIRRFYARRAWRIYPPFYALLAFTFVLIHWGLIPRGHTSQRISEVFFLQSYLLPYYNHTWTLAVEEHFYIALPLILLAVLKLDRNAPAADPFRALPWVVVGGAVLGLSLRIANLFAYEEIGFWTHTVPTHLRFDALLAGVGLAYAYHYHHEKFQRLHPWRYELLTFGVLMISQVLTEQIAGRPYRFTFGFLQTTIACSAVIVGSVLCRPLKNPLTNSLAWLGTHSYSMYLWHMAVIFWVLPWFAARGYGWGGQAIVAVVGTIVAGVVTAMLIESPVIRLRNWLHPPRAAAVKDFTSGIPATAGRIEEPREQASPRAA